MTLHRDESSIANELLRFCRPAPGLFCVACPAVDSEAGAALALEAPLSLNPRAPGNEPSRWPLLPAALLGLWAAPPAASPVAPFAAALSLSVSIRCASLAFSFASLFEAVVGGLVIAIRWFGVVGAAPDIRLVRGGVEGAPPLSPVGDRERDPVLLREVMVRPELCSRLPLCRPESEYVGVGGVRL